MAEAELETDQLNGGCEEDEDSHSDQDEDDPQKPEWVGYFRLPKRDVKLGAPFLPTDE